MGLVDNFVYRLEKALCFIFFVVMILIVSAEVTSRYCFGTTLMVGVQELAMWSFIWMVTMACAAMVYEKKHIAVEYFLHTFCPSIKARKAVFIATEAFLIFFFIAVILTGYPYALDQWSMKTTSANLPKTIPFLAVPVSISFMLVHSLVQLGAALKSLFQPGSSREDI